MPQLAEIDASRFTAEARETLAQIDIDRPYADQLESLAEALGLASSEHAAVRLDRLAAEMRELAGENLPALTTEEYEALRESIREHGQIYPILVDLDGSVIDGRHRQRACIELGLEPRYETIDDRHAALALVVNLARRHLTTSARRGIVRDRLLLDPGCSDRAIAAAVGVSHPTVAAVRRELEDTGDVEKVSTRSDTLGRRQPARDRAAQPPQAERAIRVLVKNELFEQHVGCWVNCSAFRLLERRPGVYELEVQLLAPEAASRTLRQRVADRVDAIAAGFARNRTELVDELLAIASDVFGREITNTDDLYTAEAEWMLAQLDALAGAPA